LKIPEGLFDRFARILTEDPDFRFAIAATLTHAFLLLTLIGATLAIDGASHYFTHFSTAAADQFSWPWIGMLFIHLLELLLFIMMVVITCNGLVGVFTVFFGRIKDLRIAFASATGPLAERQPVIPPDRPAVPPEGPIDNPEEH
jgi:hypothetical protein